MVSGWSLPSAISITWMIESSVELLISIFFLWEYWRKLYVFFHIDEIFWGDWTWNGCLTRKLSNQMKLVLLDSLPDVYFHRISFLVTILFLCQHIISMWMFCPPWFHFPFIRYISVQELMYAWMIQRLIWTYECYRNCLVYISVLPMVSFVVHIKATGYNLLFYP